MLNQNKGICSCLNKAVLQEKAITFYNYKPSPKKHDKINKVSISKAKKKNMLSYQDCYKPTNQNAHHYSNFSTENPTITSQMIKTNRVQNRAVGRNYTLIPGQLQNAYQIYKKKSNAKSSNSQSFQIFQNRVNKQQQLRINLFSNRSNSKELFLIKTNLGFYQQ